MTDGSDHASCRFDDAHAARAALRGAGRQAWDAWLVSRAGDDGTPRPVCPECVEIADIVVAECPLVSDETADDEGVRRAVPHAGGGHAAGADS